MRTTILTLTGVLFFHAALSAANLYILYDDACMDRLEYAYQNSEDNLPYIMYQVSTTPGEKIILEVGAERQTPQDFMPAQFIRCNNAVFNEQLVNAINSNIDEVHMVVRKGNRYFISPINFAARLMINDNIIMYDSPKYRFQFDRKMGTIGENIAYKNPRAEVYFEGKLENECSGAYLFHQYAEFDGNPHADIVLVPEVGIVEERSGINAEDALNNTLRLEKVNGRKLDRHLRRICDNKIAQGAPEPAEEAFTERAVQGEFTTKGATPEAYGAEAYTQPKDPLADSGINPEEVRAAQPAMHKVNKGETLYRISKQYGVSVDQIKSWNKKTNNTIFPGEQLQVSATPTASTPQSALTAKGASKAAQTPDRSPPTARKAVAPRADRFHIVRPGETVASLALQYGYTEDRFRKINSLNPNEMIKIGQQLIVDHCDCPEDRPMSYQETASPGNTYRDAAATGENLQDKGYTPESYEANSPRLPQSVPEMSAPFSDDQFGQSSMRNTPFFIDRNPSTGQPAGYGRQTPQPYDAPAATEYDKQAFYNKGAATPQSYNASSQGRQPKQVRTVYIVKEGDSLFNIARTYGTTVQRLREINNLEKNEVLIPYQRIYLN